MLERFVPEPLLVERDHVDVAVPPQEAYAKARALDLARSPILRTLFTLRTLPGRLRGQHVAIDKLTLEEIGSHAPGFVILADKPGVGFAAGAVGKFWKPNIEFVEVTPETFAEFDTPGYARVAWAVQFEPAGGHGTRIVFELRLDATDEASWRVFRRYFAVVGPFSHYIRRHFLSLIAGELGGPDDGAEPRELQEDDLDDDWHEVGQGWLGAFGMLFNLVTPFLRRTRSRWGLDEATARRELPGDEIVADPRWSWTHGIEVDAPPEDVWPWMAQLGQERGGFYSYQWLEKLAGCEIRNADRIHPEWQDVQVGDPFRLHPQMPPLRVVDVEPGRWFVVEAGEEFRIWPDLDREKAAHGSWLFYVEPLDDGRRSRVISRFRADFTDDLATRLMYGPWLTESIGFVMDRRMLIGIKERVERPA